MMRKWGLENEPEPERRFAEHGVCSIDLEHMKVAQVLCFCTKYRIGNLHWQAHGLTRC